MRFVPIKTVEQQSRLMVHRTRQAFVEARTMANDCTAAQQLMQIIGIGEVTATAVAAMVGNAREFSNSRQFA